MNKQKFLYLIAVLVGICAFTTSTIVMVGHYNTTRASGVFDAPTLDMPEEPIETGDTIYLRQIGSVLKAEHYHNYPDQQDKSRIHTVAQ